MRIKDILSEYGEISEATYKRYMNILGNICEKIGNNREILDWSYLKTEKTYDKLREYRQEVNKTTYKNNMNLFLDSLDILRRLSKDEIKDYGEKRDKLKLLILEETKSDKPDNKQKKIKKKQMKNLMSDNKIKGYIRIYNLIQMRCMEDNISLRNMDLSEINIKTGGDNYLNMTNGELFMGGKLLLKLSEKDMTMIKSLLMGCTLNKCEYDESKLLCDKLFQEKGESKNKKQLINGYANIMRI